MYFFLRCSKVTEEFSFARSERALRLRSQALAIILDYE